MKDHPRTKLETALKAVQGKTERLKIDKWLKVYATERIFAIEVDEGGFAKESRLEKIDLGVNRLIAFLVCLILLLTEFGLPGKANGSDFPPLENQTIVFSTIFPETTPFFSEMSDIYKEAFSRLGFGFKLINQPGERALIDANLGKVDGESARIENIDNEKYPNLIMVPYPIIAVKEGAYSIDHSILINGWENLTGKQYTVGLLKGIKSVEQKLPLYVDKKNIVSLSTPEQCMKMLQAKRIDLVIMSTQIEESEFMRTEAYKEIKCVGIIETKLLYPWLHKRYKNLVRPLADILKTMKSEGWF